MGSPSKDQTKNLKVTPEGRFTKSGQEPTLTENIEWTRTKERKVSQARERDD